MSEIKIESTVLKMSIGKTDKDERTETSGLCTKLSFDVVGSPRSLARMANLLKQGNVNIKLVVVATNAATDVNVETVDLPHQMGLGEQPVPPVSDLTANAGHPPITGADGAGHPVEDKPEPGTTPVRAGEPITPEEKARQTEEANRDFDAMKSGSDKPGVVIVDLSSFKVKMPAEGQDEYTVSLDGVKKKGADLVSCVMTVFNSKAVSAATPKDLINTLLLYPQSKNRDILLEVLQIGGMPEKVGR